MAQVLCPVVIGRDAELEAVDAALTAAMTGHGGCVVITGEPGIGKSRLVLETASRAASRGVRVVTGRAVPQSATAAYRPLTDALVQLLRDRAVPGDPTMEPWLPALGALLPVMAGLAPASGSASGEVSPGIRGEALIQLLRRLAPQGLVIVLEDLHWADPDTVALMEYLGEHLDGESLLCVLTLRANRPSAALEVTRRQRGRPGVLHLGLDRLSDEDMARMVHACIPGAEPELLRRVQASAEGVPLLVEDLLASPGLPESFTETVRERLAGFSEPQRSVIEAAAILGRHFDWELLPAVSGQTADLVAETLGLAVEQLLVSADGTAFRFRHALTREALLDTMLPPRQRALASAALAVLDAAHPRLEGGLRELAVDLANRAGDRRRAGTLLSESGGQALAWGALATAIGTLRRAADLLEGTPEREQAELLLVESLALAGRVEEAAAAGGQLITRLGTEAPNSGRRSTFASARPRWPPRGGRWPVTISAPPGAWPEPAHRLACAPAWASSMPRLPSPPMTSMRPGFSPRKSSPPRTVRRTSAVTRWSSSAGATGCVICPPPAPRSSARWSPRRPQTCRCGGCAPCTSWAPSTSLITPEWRGCPRRGAPPSRWVRWVPRRSWSSSSPRASPAAGNWAPVMPTPRPPSPPPSGSAWTRSGPRRWRYWPAAPACAPTRSRQSGTPPRPSRPIRTTGCSTASAGPAGEQWFCSVAMPRRPRNPTPGEWRSWPASRMPNRRGCGRYGRCSWPHLVIAGRHRAIEEARRLGVGAFRMNRSLIGYAEAVLAGRAGQRQRANELAAACDAGFTNCEGWGDLARFCAAPAALADGWGDPLRWLAEAEAGFDRRDLPRLAEQCRELLKESQPNPWVAAGITAREADVLRLVAGGLANKQIAARLDLSPRTVEKHVESLLRKTGARSRTGLVAAASPAAIRDSQRPAPPPATA